MRYLAGIIKDIADTASGSLFSAILLADYPSLFQEHNTVLS
jgi:hypothetical protein